jgi:hypothetical protein
MKPRSTPIFDVTQCASRGTCGYGPAPDRLGSLGGAGPPRLPISRLDPRTRHATRSKRARSPGPRQGSSETSPGEFRYDLADISRGEVPASPAFAHKTADLAAITTSVRTADAPVIGSHVWAPVLPDVFYGPSDETLLQGGQLNGRRHRL